jgi:hypothetical protein
MSCCGQKRSSFIARPPGVRWTAGASQPAARPPSPATPPQPQAGALVALRAVSSGGMVVRGPTTGRQYAFSAAQPVQMVEGRDAAALLRTSWFRLA